MSNAILRNYKKIFIFNASNKCTATPSYNRTKISSYIWLLRNSSPKNKGKLILVVTQTEHWRRPVNKRQKQKDSLRVEGKERKMRGHNCVKLWITPGLLVKIFNTGWKSLLAFLSDTKYMNACKKNNSRKSTELVVPITPITAFHFSVSYYFQN